MVTVNEFYKAQDECVTLLESIEITAKHASNLMGFVGFKQEDDHGVITEMQPMYKEHFDNLQKSSRLLSSYSDRFINKLNQFKEVLDKIDCE